MTQVNVTQTDGMVSIIVGVAGTTLHPVYNLRPRIYVCESQKWHVLASCLASEAHHDSSVRCRYDLTGAEIVAEAPDNAPTRFSGLVLV